MSDVETILRIEEVYGFKDKKDRWMTMSGYVIETNKQSIKLLIDDCQNCCESWGYFWCNDNPQYFIGADIVDISLTDTALNEAKMKENDVDPTSLSFEGGIMFVNINTSKGQLQFVAYNEHNGYYGHTAKVISTQLTEEDTL